MQRTSSKKRASIIACLIEGNSIASTTRITGAAKNTIIRVLEEVGEAASNYMHETMVDLPCERLELDEIWSFCGSKEKAKKKAKGDPVGDVWTWIAVCADTKLIPSYFIGDRSSSAAFTFCNDLAPRLAGRVQITSDGLDAYKWAIGSAFDEVDYARLVKIYGTDEAGKDIVTGIRKEAVFGNPDEDLVSTSYVERQNLTVRMQNRRFTRKTNAFSKKLENHAHAMAIHFLNYNFARKHKTLKTTPAVAAGIADHVWTIDDIIKMTDAYLMAKADAEFEAAFAERQGKPRTTPKTFASRLMTPWYLDPESGGPNPRERKEGVRYEKDDGNYTS